MIELLKFFPLISLIITHPLEQLSVKDYCQPETPIVFLNDNSYIAPDDGVVKTVVENNGLYQITLLLDNGMECVYSGLTILAKKTGDRFIKKDYIGIDTTILPDTKFILMFYEESELFPQFLNRSLTFLIERGTPLYMVADGMIVNQDFLGVYSNASIYTQMEAGKDIPQSYIPSIAGGFSQVKLVRTNTYISYWHLMSWRLNSGEIVDQGERLATSGNTGVSTSPRLVLHFQDAELGSDIRVIYFRGLQKE